MSNKATTLDLKVGLELLHGLEICQRFFFRSIRQGQDKNLKEQIDIHLDCIADAIFYNSSVKTCNVIKEQIKSFQLNLNRGDKCRINPQNFADWAKLTTDEDNWFAFQYYHNDGELKTILKGTYWDKDERRKIAAFYRLLDTSLVNLVFEISLWTRKGLCKFLYDDKKPVNSNNKELIDDTKTCLTIYQSALDQLKIKRIKGRNDLSCINGKAYEYLRDQLNSVTVESISRDRGKHKKNLIAALEEDYTTITNNKGTAKKFCQKYAQAINNLLRIYSTGNSNIPFANPNSPEDQFRAYCFLFGIMLWSWKYLYYFPIINYEKNTGGISLSRKNELSDEEIIFLITFVEQLFYPLSLLERETSLVIESTKSAVAAITARNMSHNIGSHVLYHYNPANYRNEERMAFNYYEQARMDYVAYVTTITPVYGNGFLLQDVIDEFNRNEVLTKGLVASEGFEKVCIEIENDSYGKLLFFPMGELGKQAFFNILEGIIRNSAKYGYANGKKANSLKLKIASEDKGKYVEISVWAEGSKTYATAKEELGLGDSDKEKDARFQRLIDDAGQLQDKYWGIKEMRIASLFLRKLEMEKINNSTIEPLPLDLVEKNEGLCYVINMLKYKLMLIIAKNEIFEEGKYKYKYIDIVSKDKLKEINTEYKLCGVCEGVTLNDEEKSMLPLRRLENLEIKSSDNKADQQEQALALTLYSKWLKNRCAQIDDLEIFYHPNEKIKNSWQSFIHVVNKIKKGPIIFKSHLFQNPKVTQQVIDEIKPLLYIQDVSGATQWLKTKMNNPPKDEFQKEQFALEIKEAAIEPVIIFDERLWKQYKEKKSYFQDGQKIIIVNIKEENSPSQKIIFKDLKDETVVTIKKNGADLSVNINNNLDKKYTFACFHLGILDKISKNFSVDIDSVISKLKTIKNFEHIVIHSGRGKTLKTSHMLLYMDFTSLYTWLREGKVLLVQGLYSLKPLKP